MSRQYLNDRWCVRCSKKGPTPYLRTHVQRLRHPGQKWRDTTVLDLGCGNGRNTKFMRKKHCRVIPLDMAGPMPTVNVTLGKDTLPCADGGVNVVLCNFLLMFLDSDERRQLLHEINRVTAPGGFIVVEMYPAKDSYAPNKYSVRGMTSSIANWLQYHGWSKVLCGVDKFIMCKQREARA